MDKYSGIACPICDKPLDNGQTVVVCPQCGAPYHKDCVVAKGHCIYDELHQKNESWQPPKKEEQEEKYDGKAPSRCSRCSTINPVDGLFCQVCGNQLNKKDNQGFNASNQNQTQQTPFGFHEMPYNPFTTPFGGVGADEVIDDVSAKDLAIFVGKNSHYYLPKFKQISKTKTSQFNWAAFFFQGGFFLYRKMYAIGIIFMIATFLLEIPSSLMLLNNMSQTFGTLPFSIDVQTLAVLEMVCMFLNIGLRILMAVYANKLYKKSCYDKINKIKQMNKTENEYYQIITKKGNVATKLILTLVILYFALSFVLMYSSLLLGV